VTKPIDQREREDLCDLFLELGPDAPTLCEGWTTLDLAVHLMLREHFRRWTAPKMAKEKPKGLPAVIARLRRGAPLIPWRLPGLRRLLNGAEYFIHHEDVRRANGRTRRTDRPDLDDLAWAMTGFSGRRVARAMRPFALEITSPDGRHRRFGSGQSAVLRGEPTELLLYLSGRRSAAEVALEGPAEATQALESANPKL
jgi:uncharacterized protein (TIGR03085 family)